MESVQGTEGYGHKPAVLLDLSGSDREFALRDNCHAMIVPLAPTSVYDIPGQNLIEALPGSVVFVPAGTMSALVFRKSFDTLIILIGGGDETTLRSSRHSNGQSLPEEVLLVTSPQPIGAIAQIARRISSARQGFTPECVDAVAQLLLAEILLQATSRSRATHSPYRRYLDGGSIRAIDRYLDDHLEDQLCLDDLADHAHMTRHQFSRRFKNATGVSPFQYVIAKRVKRARDLLARGTDSIAEIAYATGFSSQSHLTETFKRHFGVTPGAYKREHCRPAA